MNNFGQNTQGSISIPRNILLWKHYGDITTVCVYLHILLHAERVSDGDNTQWVSCLTSKDIMTALNLTPSQFRTSIQKLLVSGNITREAHKHQFFIPNYEKNGQQS